MRKNIGHVWFMFFRAVFENIENTILVVSGNCSYFMNLVFSIFFVFFRRKKKLRTKHVLFIFLVLFVFKNIKEFSKTKNGF